MATLPIIPKLIQEVSAETPDILWVACQAPILKILPKTLLGKLSILVIVEDFESSSRLRAWMNRNDLNSFNIRIVVMQAKDKIFSRISAYFDIIVIDKVTPILKQFLIRLLAETFAESKKIRFLCHGENISKLSDVIRKSCWKHYGNGWHLACVKKGPGTNVKLISEKPSKFLSEDIVSEEEI